MTNQKSVLIIDDEEEIRTGVSRWLEATGCRTLSAADGVQGAASASENQPDAILLDMMMPKLDGMQTLARLREDPETCRIPVIMLSASLRDEQRALDAGARFFVQKPYDGKKLIETVSTVINEAE